MLVQSLEIVNLKKNARFTTYWQYAINHSIKIVRTVNTIFLCLQYLNFKLLTSQY